MFSCAPYVNCYSVVKNNVPFLHIENSNSELILSHKCRDNPFEQV